MVEKFFCYDLRLGISIFGIINLVMSGIIVMVHLALSMIVEDPDVAATHTFLTGGHLLNFIINACLSIIIVHGVIINIWYPDQLNLE